MQHQEFINALNGTLTTVLCIETFDQDESNDDDEDEYVLIQSMWINVAGIERHIRS